MQENIRMLHNEWTVAKKNLNDFRLKVNAAFTTEVILAAKKKNPKKKKWEAEEAAKCVGEEFDALKQQMQEKFNDEHEKKRSAVAVAKEAYEKALKTAEPTPGTNWFFLHAVYPSSYSSQGYGAESYAKIRAQLNCDEYINGSPNIPCRVLSVDLDRNKPKHGLKYVVQCRVNSKLDAIIVEARRKPLDLRAWVKRCWALGANPRVFMPFLPHGFEDGAGLDRFGGETCGPKEKKE